MRYFCCFPCSPSKHLLSLPKTSPSDSLLGGSWDMVTIHTWAYNPPSNWGNPYEAVQGDDKKAHNLNCKQLRSPLNLQESRIAHSLGAGLCCPPPPRTHPHPSMDPPPLCYTYINLLQSLPRNPKPYILNRKP